MSLIKNLKGKGMSSDNILRELFKISINAVQPHKLIEKSVSVTGRHLSVNGKNYELKKPVRIVGFGKGVYGMAVALEKTLGDLLQRGILSVPEGSLNMEKRIFENLKKNKIEFMEGARNNLPDENSMKAAVRIKDFVRNLDQDDTVIVLISGGGSALLPLPKDSVTLREKLDLIKTLGKKGADICELNCVRKELSQLKGGGLAAQCYPARVISLILSDVLGDPLDIIASGPTCPNSDGPEKAMDVLVKYSLYEDLPTSIKETLRNNAKRSELKNEEMFGKVDNFIIGNNLIAAREALQKSKEIGLQSLILSTNVSGNVEEVSCSYEKIATSIVAFQKYQSSHDKLIHDLLSLEPQLIIQEKSMLIDDVKRLDPKRNICVILAGEPTVNVTGEGIGGRNQQLALSFSLQLSKIAEQSASVDIWFLSCGTDGIDGPTDAAGAIGFSSLFQECSKENLASEQYLSDNDSYSFYSRFCGGKYLVKTGHTGTNVMDIHIMLFRNNLI